jgi:hypothetical protein
MAAILSRTLDSKELFRLKLFLQTVKIVGFGSYANTDAPSAAEIRLIEPLAAPISKIVASLVISLLRKSRVSGSHSRLSSVL